MIAPKLRFSEFKDEWKKEPLGKVVNFSNGKRIPLSEAERKIRQGEYRYYGASGVIDYIDDYIFDGQYILIGEDGANILNRSSPLAFVVNGKFWVNNHAHIFQSKLGNNLFLATYLESLNYEKHNSGTAQPKLNLENLKKIEVANPSTQEQTKIAEFLSAVDDKISQLSRQLELLNQYKKGVMQKIFSQEIRFKNDNGEDFGEWVDGTLGDVTTLVSRRNKNGINAEIYSVTNSQGFVKQNEFFEDRRVAGEDTSNYKIIYKNEFSYNPARINVGSIALFDKEEIGIISSLYVCFQANQNVSLQFLNQFLNWEKTIQNYSLYGEGGVRIYLWYPLFSKIPFSYPTIQEQAKIAEFLTAIDERIDHTTAQLTHTKQWKKGLLQQMFV